MTARDDPETRSDAEKLVQSSNAAALLSVGGILAGLAAASCCVVPFLLFLAGISGAWIANLTALEPYRPYFAGIAIGGIGYGFYRVYRRPAAACVRRTNVEAIAKHPESKSRRRAVQKLSCGNYVS